MSDLKIIYTGQGYVHNYENLKRKLCNCNANVYFNPYPANVEKMPAGGRWDLTRCLKG